MRSHLLVPLGACAAAALAIVCLRSPDGHDAFAASPARAPALEAAQPCVQTAPRLAGSIAHRREVALARSRPSREVVPRLPLVEESSPQDAWRTYDLPFLPEGAGWIVSHEVETKGGPVRRLSEPITPDTLHAFLSGWIESPGRPDAPLPGACKVEARKRLHVQLADELHARLAGVMAISRWSVVDLSTHTAARELAAMLEAPSSEERAWARSALRSAAREIDDALVLVRERERMGSGVGPDARTGAAKREGRLALSVRSGVAEPNLLRDLAVDVRSLGLRSWGGFQGGASPAGSAFSYLDDTQMEVLLRVCERRPSRLDLQVHEQILQAGQPVVLDLGACGRLTFEAALLPASDRFVEVHLACRRLVAGGLRFHPHQRWIHPNRGTLLLQCHARYGSLLDEPTVATVVVTLEILDELERAETPATLPLHPEAFTWTPMREAAR